MENIHNELVIIGMMPVANQIKTNPRKLVVFKFKNLVIFLSPLVPNSVTYTDLA